MVIASEPSIGTVVLIVNPTAGRGMAGRQVPEIRRLLGDAAKDWVWHFTEKSGDAMAIACKAADAGARLVVAVGGDGTLHEVMNGVLGSGATVGLIPYGTGNDFARALGLYGNLEIACKTLTQGVVKNVDVGLIEGEGTHGPRHFLVLAGTGFDARTAQTVNAGIRFLSGPLAYVWGAIMTLWSFKPFALTLQLDDGPARKVKAMFVSFANAETTGGGMKIAPGAKVDDGWLDVCLVEAVSKLTLLYNLTQIFSGRHLRCPAVSMHRAKCLTVDADPPQPLLIDGEVCGTTPATIKLLPSALPFLVPAL
ncbi:MAG: diacylglycerol/lipid kinase family protein [Janthinobacterium lividum]